MTGGGPAGATTTLTYYLYNNAYQWFKLGYSSVIAIFLAFILFLLGAAFIRTIERNSIRISLNSGENLEPSINQNREKSRFFLIFPFAILIVVAILQFFPFLWAFLTSLKEPVDVFTYPPELFSQHLVWENYIKAWKAVPMERFYLNSLVQTIPSVLLQLVVGLFAGYALSVLRPKRYRLTEFFLLFPIFLHTSIIRLPIFIFIKKAHLVDTYFALCLPTYIWWGRDTLIQDVL
jgi:ABC-type sugar transport system permease subunit